ncbi:hypothetical protein KY360_05840 [Candidatus Woesearchaeota archaeon]|nr:hypothetical protein [Candidatus Woesearchaeota archaeon]
MFVLIFIALIIVFGFRGVQQIRVKREQLSIVEMKSDIQEIVEESVPVGVTETQRLELPKGKDICFIDLSQRVEVLGSSQIDEYPEVRDILTSGVEENIFVLEGNNIIDSTYARVCLESYPHFICTQFIARPLDLLIEGRGTCASIFFKEVIIAGDNQKNTDSYPADAVFIMRYKLMDWRETISLIPVTMWNDQGTLREYKYIVYAIPQAANIEASKIRTVLVEHGSINALVFGTVSGQAPGFVIKQLAFREEDYFSFWEKYQDIVLIGFDNEDSSLMAALYAAELNAPLIFVDDKNIKDYEEWIDKKKIHIIDTLDLGKNSDVLNVANLEIHVSGEELRTMVSGDFDMLKSLVEVKD